MRVRIVSDGHGRGTRVELIDDSTPFPTRRILERVQAVRWEIDRPNGIAKATIEVLAVEVAVEADDVTVRDRDEGPGKRSNF